MNGGGYVYHYTATQLPEVKAMLHELLDTWIDTCHEAIDEFGLI